MNNEVKNNSTLHQEWVALHASYERSEGLSLIVKLSAVSACLIGLICNLNDIIISLFLSILWLQEAIWKTFQGRTEQRLLTLEQNIEQDKGSSGFQFYSVYSLSRPGTVGLISEYIKNALRPTIAYPYVVLIIFNTVFNLIN